MIFDVGAFRGDKTAAYLKEGHDVVCFEPNPLYAERLRQRFGARVTIVEKAVGAEQGKAILMICPRAPAISTLCENWKTGRFSKYHWDQKVKVELTTLDQAIEMYGFPDYIKIDVEGYEYEVLKGLSVAVPCLSFEFAREFIGASYNSLHRLKKIGYKQFAFQLGKLNPLGSYMNISALLPKLYSMSVKVWGNIYTRKENMDESSRMGYALA